MKGRSRLYPISIIMIAAFLAAGPANAVYAAEPNGSWVNLDGNWYWKKTDGTAYIGWLYTGGRFYDMNFSVNWGMKKKNSILMHIQTENGNMTAITTPVMTGMQALLWI